MSTNLHPQNDEHDKQIYYFILDIPKLWNRNYTKFFFVTSMFQKRQYVKNDPFCKHFAVIHVCLFSNLKKYVWLVGNDSESLFSFILVLKNNFTFHALMHFLRFRAKKCHQEYWQRQIK